MIMEQEMKIFIDAMKEKYHMTRFDVDVNGYKQGYDEEECCYWARCEAVLKDKGSWFVCENDLESMIKIKFIEDGECEVTFTNLADIKRNKYWGELTLEIDPEYVYDFIDLCWN